jgi:hypothetical protein
MHVTSDRTRGVERVEADALRKARPWPRTVLVAMQRAILFSQTTRSLHRLREMRTDCLLIDQPQGLSSNPFPG